jgi:prepilin-type N-terminal cleavage/methylation domain-containing protein
MARDDKKDAFTPLDRQSRHQTAFTLIELLIVIAIIAILSVVVVISLNPAEMLRQSRDANRISDLDTINKALALAITDAATTGGSLNLGSTSTVYLSLTDTSSTCGNLGLPTLPSGYSYHCSTATSSRNTDSNGWIPVNLKNVTTGSPLGNLPIDPQNSSSSDLYYTYQTNGSTYKITASLESQKYAKSAASDGGTDPALLESGSGIASLPDLGRGLVGYWPMDEGSGTTAYDMSGNGNNGNLTCYGTGCSGPAWASGKIGNGDIQFIGTTGSSGPGSVVATVTGYSGVTTQLTWTAWIYPMATNNDQMFIGNIDQPGNYFRINSGKLILAVNLSSGQKTLSGTTVLSNNQWYFVAGRYDGNTMTVYLNGNQDSMVLASSTLQSLSWGGGRLNIGAWTSGDIRPFNGFIDDVKEYNRALSAAEIQAMYNAEK